ncbi:MAG: hypothetical protein JRG91_12575 [Deltaproteobacteria bacterium]|nr:hypothetical protein [Deltaproteobacteria bacterium]
MMLDVPDAFALRWYLHLVEGEYPGFFMVETRGDLERAWQMHRRDARHGSMEIFFALIEI